MKVLSVFGTRPEALKMAPLCQKLINDKRFDSRICVTAQHREMLDQVLQLFSLCPDYDLNIMSKGQTIADVTVSILRGLEAVFDDFQPDIVLVHGDTSTTFSASLAAFYRRISIGHIEAGLRTHNLYSPWPEEANRQLTSVLTRLHFCPTQKSRENLLAENVSDNHVVVTGNTIIDALYMVQQRLKDNHALLAEMTERYSFLDRYRQIILVTAHRRENHDGGINRICSALETVASNHPDTVIVFPVHLSEKVKNPVHKLLDGLSNIFLIDPVDYINFVYLLDRADFVLTDSGGIQEEAPSLGKPVLVMRDTTERPEAVTAGTVRLVGTDIDVIVSFCEELLSRAEIYEQMSTASNPYGDGKACDRVVDALVTFSETLEN